MDQQIAIFCLDSRFWADKVIFTKLIHPARSSLATFNSFLNVLSGFSGFSVGLLRLITFRINIISLPSTACIREFWVWCAQRARAHLDITPHFLFNFFRSSPDKKASRKWWRNKVPFASLLKQLNQLEQVPLLVTTEKLETQWIHIDRQSVHC